MGSVQFMQDDWKRDTHDDDGRADQSKVNGALIYGKGHNVIDEVHGFDFSSCWILSWSAWIFFASVSEASLIRNA